MFTFWCRLKPKKIPDLMQLNRLMDHRLSNNLVIVQVRFVSCLLNPTRLSRSIEATIALLFLCFHSNIWCYSSRSGILNKAQAQLNYKSSCVILGISSAGQSKRNTPRVLWHKNNGKRNGQGRNIHLHLTNKISMFGLVFETSSKVFENRRSASPRMTPSSRHVCQESKTISFNFLIRTCFPWIKFCETKKT